MFIYLSVLQRQITNRKAVMILILIAVISCSNLSPETDYSEFLFFFKNLRAEASVYCDEFIPLCCDKLEVIYILPSNTTNLLNSTLHAECFGRRRPSSGINVHNLKPSGHMLKVFCNL
jgi:hypothetical protein